MISCIVDPGMGVLDGLSSRGENKSEIGVRLPV